MFTVIHRAVQPVGAVSVYTMRFDAAIFSDFGNLWNNPNYIFTSHISMRAAGSMLVYLTVSALSPFEFM